MVLKGVMPKLAALKELAAELNDVSDAFTEELKRVEAELNEMRIGLDVELDDFIWKGNVEHCEGDHPSGERHEWTTQNATVLAFGQDRFGNWRLLAREYVCSTRNDPDGEWQQTGERPLLESPREIRLAAAGHVGKLLDKIAEEGKKKATALRSAVEK